MGAARIRYCVLRADHSLPPASQTCLTSHTPQRLSLTSARRVVDGDGAQTCGPADTAAGSWAWPDTHRDKRRNGGGGRERRAPRSVLRLHRGLEVGDGGEEGRDGGAHLVGEGRLGRSAVA